MAAPGLIFQHKEEEYKILLNLPVQTLFNVCQINSNYRDICNSEDFWYKKLNFDFPGSIVRKPPELTFKKYYEYLHRELREKPIYFELKHKHENEDEDELKHEDERQFIGSVWIDKNETNGQVIKDIITLLKNKYPDINPFNLGYSLIGQHGENQTKFYPLKTIKNYLIEHEEFYNALPEGNLKSYIDNWKDFYSEKVSERQEESDPYLLDLGITYAPNWWDGFGFLIR